MPRSFFRDSVMVKGPAGAIPLAGAAVSFYQEAPPGSPTTPISFPLYPSREDTSPLALPFITGSLGEIEVWAEQATRVRMITSKGGLTTSDETVDLEWPPEDVASNGDVTNAIAAHEAKADPHQQYLLENEADLLYLPIDYVPPPIPDEYLTQDEADLRYAQLGLSYTKAESDARYLQEAQADLRYERLTQKGVAGGYVPLDGAGKIPNQYLPDLAITQTYVVASEAEQLALSAQVGDVAIRVDTSENYILAAEPASVLANWAKLAASTADGNTSVVNREEFTPAASSTSVNLAAVPTEVLSVTRNGVEQSAIAGHFSVAGVVLTFTDAFVAGERVSVIYEVGSASGGGGGGMSQADADLRYLQLTGGSLSGDLLAADDETQNLGGSFNRWRNLYARWGYFSADLSVDLTGYFGGNLETNADLISRGKPVKLSTDGGNTLEWRSNGFYSAATAPDLSNYYTKAQADTRYEPLDTMYTKAESDAKYALTGHTHSGTYATPTDVSTAVSNHAAAADPHTTYLNNTRGDARYALTGHNHSGTYLPMSGGALTGALSSSGSISANGANNSAYFIANTTDNTTAGYTGIRFGRGGTNIWTLGHNVGGSNADHLELYSDALGRTIAQFSRTVGTLSLSPTAGSAGIVIGGTAQPKISVQSGAPSSPATGDLWIW